MSAVKTKTIWKTVGFSKDKLSKYKINKTIISEKFFEEEPDTVFIRRLEIGNYIIRVYVRGNVRKNFSVLLYEKRRDGTQILGPIQYEKVLYIDPSKDIRFKDKSWTKRDEHILTKSELIDAVLHCHRLDKLKMFS